MKGITDISDWTTCEALGTYDFDYKNLDSISIDHRLKECSPIFHIDKVKFLTCTIGVYKLLLYSYL